MHRPQRLLILLLFAWGLALRAWVPAGWMPTPGAHDLSIMPCPGAETALNMDMGHGAAHHEHSGSDCFSPLLAGAALPGPPGEIAAPPPAAPVERALPALTRLHSGLAAPPPHSTGPPALA